MRDDLPSTCFASSRFHPQVTLQPKSKNNGFRTKRSAVHDAPHPSLHPPRMSFSTSLSSKSLTLINLVAHLRGPARPHRLPHSQDKTDLWLLRCVTKSHTFPVSDVFFLHIDKIIVELLVTSILTILWIPYAFVLFTLYLCMKV